IAETSLTATHASPLTSWNVRIIVTFPQGLGTEREPTDSESVEQCYGTSDGETTCSNIVVTPRRVHPRSHGRSARALGSLSWSLTVVSCNKPSLLYRRWESARNCRVLVLRPALA